MESLCPVALLVKIETMVRYEQGYSQQQSNKAVDILQEHLLYQRTITKIFMADQNVIRFLKGPSVWRVKNDLNLYKYTKPCTNVPLTKVV